MAEYRGDPNNRSYPSSNMNPSYHNQQQQSQQQAQRHAHVPQVTVTAATSPIDESPAALRRPLNLGIATAAANSAARAASAAQRPMQQYNGNNNNSPSSGQQQQQQQSRVQQKLQRNNNNGPPSPSYNQPMPPSGHDNHNARQQQHVPQQQQRHGPQPTSRQAGPPGIRPFELRSDMSPQYNQQQSRRPDLPVLQVAVPSQVHQPAPNGNGRLPQQQQRYNQPAPFSSSAETLVGGYSYDKDKWSPSSSTGSSSSHAHHGQQQQVPSTPRSPFVVAASGGPLAHPNSPYGYGNPPSSPSIKNFQLQVPNAGNVTADSENDRLSPAMPRLRNGGGPGGADSQRDWWKRFSTVVRENEQKEVMAEKIGGKGSKVQSEWLDAQTHRQRNYRIWVGVIAFLILAGIGGGVAYHYVTKDKDSENAVTVPTTHGIEITKSDPSTTAASVAPSSVVLASPSAVPAGNNLGTRDGIAKRSGNDEALAMPVKLLAARSIHAHARRHKNLHHLD